MHLANAVTKPFPLRPHILKRNADLRVQRRSPPNPSDPASWCLGVTYVRRQGTSEQLNGNALTRPSGLSSRRFAIVAQLIDGEPHHFL